MVASRNLVLADSPILYKEDVSIDRMEGCGLVDFNIRPHFNSEKFSHVTEENLDVVAKNIQDTIIAIDDQSAVKVDDGNITVVTEGTWKQFN
jgi:dipeptidase E